MLNTLPKINKNDGKRQGRGYGSGKGGHTTGKGSKGHKSRSGYASPRPGFEGGQMPLSRRLPKLKGFTRAYFKTTAATATLTLSALNVFDNGSVVDLKALKEKKLIKASAVKAKVVTRAVLTRN
jgi:large subunit ribosomal protein L15